MSTKVTEKKKPASKESILTEITLLLSQALPALKESLGEKKFGKRIKKAAKLLTEGIKSADSKKANTTKPPAVKAKKEKAKIPAPAKKTAKTTK